MATNPTEAEKLLILRINNAQTDAIILDLIRAHVAHETELANRREAALRAELDRYDEASTDNS